jgi:hypothetical protein
MFSKDIATNPLRIVNGHIEIPKNYGVCVRIDEEELKKYEVNVNFLEASLKHAAFRIYLGSPSLVKEAVRKALSIARKGKEERSR